MPFRDSVEVQLQNLGDQVVAVQSIIDSVRPIWQRLLERVIQGPTLTGQVVDSSGNPLEVNVSLEEVKLQAVKTSPYI